MVDDFSNCGGLSFLNINVTKTKENANWLPASIHGQTVQIANQWDNYHGQLTLDPLKQTLAPLSQRLIFTILLETA